MKKTALPLLLLLLALPLQADIHPLAGTRAANLLSSGGGARPRAMGNAFTAVPKDFNAIFFNPAALGTAQRIHMQMSKRRTAAEADQSQFGVVVPLAKFDSPFVRSFGAFGLSASYADYGSFSGYDAAGVPSGSFSAEDAVGDLGYGKLFGDRLGLGASVRLYHLRLAEKTADGAAYSVGGIFVAVPERWTVGFAAVNLGPSVRYVSGDAPLPRALSAGAAFTPWNESLTLAMDMVDPEDHGVYARGGVEWWAVRALAFRAGYNTSYDAGTGLSVGIGVKVDQLTMGFFPVNRFGLDYAYLPSEDIADAHNISLTFRFGEN